METGIGAGTRMETEAGNRGGIGQEKARSVGHDGKQRGRRRVRAETDMRSRNKIRDRKRWVESLGTGPVTANNGVNGHRFLRGGWTPEGQMQDAFPAPVPGMEAPRAAGCTRDVRAAIRRTDGATQARQDFFE